MTGDLPHNERASSSQTGVVAAISRKSRQDWLPFNWRVKPVVRIDVASEALLNVGELAGIQNLPLLSRFLWPQSRFPAEQIQNLLEECDLLLSEHDNEKICEVIEVVVEIAHKIESKKHAYPDILWMLVDRCPPQLKGESKSKQYIKIASDIENTS